MMRLLVLLAVASALANTFNPLPEYEFSWAVDEPASKLTIGIVLTPPASKSFGWVGFGIAGSGGGMLGGDVFTAFPTGTTCALQDRKAKEKAVLPVLDTQNGGFADWTVESCSYAGNVFNISASRALTTYDPLDLDFVGGPMTLLFSWSTQTPTQNGTSLSFHDGGYTPREMSLWGEQIPIFDPDLLPSDTEAERFLMPNLTIGNSTSYTCVGFNITQLKGQPTHAVVFDPIVVEENVPYVHHMVVYVCEKPYNSTPFPCFSMPTDCKQILFTWGKGGGPMVLPNVTGISVGMPGRQHIVLQMHYTNDDNVPDLVDASGLAIYRTNALRPQDTGAFLFGTIRVSVPAQHHEVTISGNCNHTASAALLPPAGVTVYASFLHAHERGRRIWTSVFRNGTMIATLGNNQNYDFNLQKVQLFSPVHLQQGDEIITYCTYNTSMDLADVVWGEATENEMCFNFLYYYPIINVSLPTMQCGTRGNPVSAGRPGNTTCVLQPRHPPTAYTTSGFAQADTNFMTGGNVSCAAGFEGTAALGCTGFGAPFTFAGCSRPRGGAPTSAPTSADLSSAHAVSSITAISIILALFQ